MIEDTKRQEVTKAVKQCICRKKVSHRIRQYDSSTTDSDGGISSHYYSSNSSLNRGSRDSDGDGNGDSWSDGGGGSDSW